MIHTDLTRTIDQGPSGPRVAAMFDLDRTILAGFSAVDFIREGFLSGRISPSELVDTIVAAAQFEMGSRGFSDFVTATSASLAGLTATEFEEIGEAVYEKHLASNVFPESRALVEAHLRRGHSLAIVSSATRAQVAPFARDLGIENVLCTELEVRDGVLTGDVVRPTCYGDGKATAARGFAAARGIDLRDSYFYSDSDEDLPLLDIVGHPCPTNPNRRLQEIARQRGWPIRSFTSRGTPGIEPIVRTSLAIWSLLPSMALAGAAALFDGSLRRGINVAMSTWGELGTAIAGIDLQVEGEHHLWSKRPAVFIFNHQSGIEMLALCKLLRRDVVGVAKREARMNPIFGPLMTAAGTVFIDRTNREQAIQAMAPAVEALRQGLSVSIAPEGTRSSTPRLGPFKKGAFHLAMAARVPIVPIVFRNSLDALPKHAYFVRPATIEVVVHKPISTKKWTPENLDRKIEQVRRIYLETLDQKD